MLAPPANPLAALRVSQEAELSSSEFGRELLRKTKALREKTYVAVRIDGDYAYWSTDRLRAGLACSFTIMISLTALISALTWSAATDRTTGQFTVELPRLRLDLVYDDGAQDEGR